MYACVHFLTNRQTFQMEETQSILLTLDEDSASCGLTGWDKGTDSGHFWLSGSVDPERKKGVVMAIAG